MKLEFLSWRWSKESGGYVGLSGGRWTGSYGGCCLSGLSGSKRESTSSLILLASFCHHVAEAEGAR